MLQRRNTPEAVRTKPAAFVWDDPFLLEDQLDPEERMIRDAARGYAQDRLAPRAVEANRHERFDREIMTEMGAWGCSARRSRRNSAGPASAMWPMA
jgi:glutaryl-CoA dehydrogenase